jgi:RNA polymerase-binding transcription factor DksA
MSDCVTCKKPIDPKTLEMHPKAKRCAECSKAALAKITKRVGTSQRTRKHRSS